MDLTAREKEILGLLKKDPIMSREEIAQKLGISVSAVGTHIHNLTAKGYILGRGYIVAPQKRVVVIGGSNVDLKGYAVGEYIQGTSNPGILKESLGGVGRNIAENLGLLGQDTILLSAVGNDTYGSKLIKQTEKPSLKLDFILYSTKNRTGTYLAHINSEGELIGAISDMRIMDEISPAYILKHRRIIENALFVVIDANLREDTIDCILGLACSRNVKVVAEPVSIQKCQKLPDKMNSIDILTPNLSEAMVLLNVQEDLKRISFAGQLKKLKNYYVRSGISATIVVTMGAKGVLLLSPEINEFFSVPEVVVPKKLVETTGAGDALTAGMVYGLVNGKDLKDAVQLGMKAAAITVVSDSAVNIRLKELLFKDEIEPLRGEEN